MSQNSTAAVSIVAGDTLWTSSLTKTAGGALQSHVTIMGDAVQNVPHQREKENHDNLLLLQLQHQVLGTNPRKEIPLRVRIK